MIRWRNPIHVSNLLRAGAAKRFEARSIRSRWPIIAATRRRCRIYGKATMIAEGEGGGEARSIPLP